MVGTSIYIMHAITNLHFPDCKPALKDIYKLEIYCWPAVALELGLTKYDVHVIELSYHQHDKNRLQKVEMLNKWLLQDLHATFGKLAKALLAAGEASCGQKVAMENGLLINMVGLYF